MRVPFITPDPLHPVKRGSYLAGVEQLWRRAFIGVNFDRTPNLARW